MKLDMDNTGKFDVLVRGIDDAIGKFTGSSGTVMKLDGVLLLTDPGDVEQEAALREVDSQRGLFNFMRGLARSGFASEGYVPPVFAIGLDGGVLLILCRWPDERIKVACLNGLRSLMRIVGARRYAMLSEVWSAIEHGSGSKLMPSEREDRDEAVTVFAVEPGQPVLVALLPIIRPFDGSPATLGEHDSEDAKMSFEGRMLALLDDKDAATTGETAS